MDSLTAVPRTRLLLLFLLLSPLGGWCRSMPLTKKPNLPLETQDMAEVPEKMKGLGMQDTHPVDVPVAQRTAFASIPVSRPQPVLTRQLQSTTRRTDCFGRRMDRIGSSSSLGCKQWRS